MSRRSSRRSRRPQGPPDDVPWAWLTREMIWAPAWRAMPLCARRALDRVMLEHMAHAGHENGNLIVTYDDFVRDGVGSRSATARAVRILEALGLLDVTLQGHRSFGGAHLPSRYALTWLPRADGTPATNRWQRIASIREARELVRRASLAVDRDAPGRSAFDAAAA